MTEAVRQHLAASDMFFNSLGLLRLYHQLPEDKDFEGLAHRVTRTATVIGSKPGDLCSELENMWPMQQPTLQALRKRDPSEVTYLKEQVRGMLRDIRVDEPEGLFFLLATDESTGAGAKYRPLCGAVIQITEDERKVRIVFCRETFLSGTLPPSLVKELMRQFALRISIEAMHYEEINNEMLSREKRHELKGNQKGRLLTIEDEELMFFPLPFLDFFIRTLKLHHHLEDFASHADGDKCNCLKPTARHSTQELMEGQKFWGAWFKRWLSIVSRIPPVKEPSRQLTEFFLTEHEEIQRRCNNKRRRVAQN